jgi:hypothetical protein
MGKNSKPILSVLVEEEKKEQFAELARRNKYSMGWLLNDCIDRMLEADSIGIYRDSIGNIDNTPNTQPDSTTGLNIEELVKSYVDNYLNISSIGNKDAEEIVKSYVDKLGIETLINTSIGLAIEPITQTIDELGTSMRERFDELEARSIEKPKTAKTTTKKSENEPEWVNGDNRSFYNLFSEDANLLIKVADAIELHSGSNDELAQVFAQMGVHKQDGTPLASSPISRIKTLVKRMNGTEAADNSKQ